MSVLHDFLRSGGLFLVVDVLTVISQGISLAQEMKLPWRRENNQSPVTSTVMISGYNTIQNPSLEVLTLAVIDESYLYEAEAEHPLHQCPELAIVSNLHIFDKLPGHCMLSFNL